MEENVDVVFQVITFNPTVINGKQTFDNMFIVLDAEDKMGAGMIYPQIESNIIKE